MVIFLFHSADETVFSPADAVRDGTVAPQRVQNMKKQAFAPKNSVPNPKNPYLCSLIADNN